MKLVCDTCGSKYSIDDSRVSGKTFKIRCKKCSGVILVRGALAPVAEPVPDARAWHAVLGGTQVGPMALGELQRRHATGELDDHALVWREGFDDWRPLGTVEEVRAIAPPSIEVAPEAMDAPAPAHPALRSERNETSVLFTLGNLAKLATPAPTSASASPGTGGEGSGLLDIRSLARTLAPAASPSRPARGSLDDLPLYAPVAFVEPAVLVPGTRRGQDRRLVWALAASMGALAIVAALLVMIVVRGDSGTAHASALPASAAPPSAPPASPAHAATPAAPSVAQAPAATAATPAAHAAPTTAAPAASSSTPATAAAHNAATTVAQAAPAAAAAPRRATPRASTAAPATSSAAPARSRVEPATPLTPPKRAADACTEVSCLVSGNADKCCEIYRDHAGSSPPAVTLPDSLDRAALGAGIARIDTSGCHDQSPAHGDVTVSVRVSPAGAVTAVTVKSSPDAALSACVTAAAHKATFAATQRGGSFAYVWRF
jgi:predicted Zn finger-like uncharacterized protein